MQFDGWKMYLRRDYCRYSSPSKNYCAPKHTISETSLAVQWLNPAHPNARSVGSILVGELRSHKPPGAAKIKKLTKNTHHFPAYLKLPIKILVLY